MRRIGKAGVVALFLLCLSHIAAAQIAPADLGATGFFGGSIMDRIQKEFAPPTMGVNNTKTNPIKVDLLDGYGTIYEFMYKGTPILVFDGAKPIDLGAGIFLPSDAFVMKSFVAIYAKADTALGVGDFPAELSSKLSAFWPSGRIPLLANGVVVRAEPAGSVFQDVKAFLKLDSFNGKDVVLFGKNKQSYTVGYMAVGTLSDPFGIKMTLTNPEFAFTRKASEPDPSISVASAATVYGHSYEFKAEGSKVTAPDIFLLKTTSLAPKELADLARAFAQPVFKLTAGTDPGWNFSTIPTFSLQPPTVVNKAAPTADQKKVVVFAAVPGANHPEWNVQGPAINVRGSLKIDALRQTIGSVDLEMSGSKLEATYGIPDFTLPGANVRFFSAMETISVTKTKAAMSITAESPSDCFNQKFSFSVSTNGTISADVDANKTLSQLTPAGFAKNFTNCAKQGAELAGWVLKTGDKVLGFAGDELMKAATPVFGGEAVATAAKAAGYSRDMIATSLSTVLDKNAMLDVAKKVYGNDQVAEFAKAAGYTAEDVFGWSRKNVVATIGEMPKLVDWKGPKIGDFVKWYGSYIASAEATAKLIGFVYFKDDMLTGGKNAYNLTWGAVARLGRAASYSATDVAHYFAANHVPKDEIIEVLNTGGYAKDQVKSAAMTVYDFSSSEAEKGWNAVVNIGEDAGKEAGKGACKMVSWMGVKC